MSMLEQDSQVFYHQIHLYVAKQLHIKNLESKSTEELSDDIKKINCTVFSKLNDFIDAYQIWVEHFQNNDCSKLIKAIEKKDSTRKILITELEKLKQCQILKIF